jgi:hypothetical protein
MKLFSRIFKSVAGKAVLAAIALGGLLALTPTNADARPVFRERGGVRVVVGGGFYGPRYVGPRYYYGPRYYGPVFVHHRYWDARFHCWRYR